MYSLAPFTWTSTSSLGSRMVRIVTHNDNHSDPILVYARPYTARYSSIPLIKVLQGKNVYPIRLKARGFEYVRGVPDFESGYMAYAQELGIW